MVQQPAGGPGDVPPPLQLYQRIVGFWVTQALYVAAELGLADQFRDDLRESDALARELGVDPPSLYRLLRALASVDVVVEERPGAFRLTPLGACLQTDHPQSMRAAARFYGDQAVWGAWGRLLDGIRSGQPAFEHAHGVGSWGYMAAHPELGATFNEFMTRLTAGRYEALLAAYDFGGIGTLVDVGGGSGATLAAILRAHPGMRGILFDLPQGLGDAAAVLTAAGVADRCGIVEGDFFAAVPAGGDAYILSGILHDWDDARASAILRSCHRAMPPGVRLLVLDPVLPPPPVSLPPAVAFLDLNMHVMEGGRERTEADLAALFAATGFELTRVAPLPPPRSLLEAVRR